MPTVNLLLHVVHVLRKSTTSVGVGRRFSKSTAARAAKLQGAGSSSTVMKSVRMSQELAAALPAGELASAGHATHVSVLVAPVAVE